MQEISTNLKKNLDHQESDTGKAKAKFKFSLDESEKLKSRFSVNKKAWDEEKVALIQREESAEATLKEVTIELSGLKRHISQMTSAICGKKLEVSQ